MIKLRRTNPHPTTVSPQSLAQPFRLLLAALCVVIAYYTLRSEAFVSFPMVSMMAIVFILPPATILLMFRTLRGVRQSRKAGDIYVLLTVSTFAILFTFSFLAITHAYIEVQEMQNGLAVVETLTMNSFK